VVLGKPIGNGHPIAAVVTSPEIAQVAACCLFCWGNPILALCFVLSPSLSLFLKLNNSVSQMGWSTSILLVVSFSLLSSLLSYVHRIIFLSLLSFTFRLGEKT